MADELVPMTHEEFHARIVSLLQARIDANPGADVDLFQEQLDELNRGGIGALKQVASSHLNSFPLIPPAQDDDKGCCTYRIDGNLFCVNDVTQPECIARGGNWSPVACNIQTVYPGAIQPPTP